DLALRAIFFGAIGTAGQRCTSTRRVIVQESIQGVLTERLVNACKTVRIGNPLEPDTVMGPLIDGQAVGAMRQAMDALDGQEGKAAAIAGRIICAVRPTRSIIPATCRWPKASTLEIIHHDREIRNGDDRSTARNGWGAPV